MLKKTITYTDFDGNQRTEEFYFNLTRAEMAELEASEQGGLSNMIMKITKSDELDQNKIIQTFKHIILLAYGEKSEDGRRFVKSKEMSEAFSQTKAYDELFWELASNGDAAIAFVNGILPPEANAVVPKQ